MLWSRWECTAVLVFIEVWGFPGIQSMVREPRGLQWVLWPPPPMAPASSGKAVGITARRYPVWLWRLPQAAAQVSPTGSTCPQLGGYQTHCLSRPLRVGTRRGAMRSKRVCSDKRLRLSSHA